MEKFIEKLLDSLKYRKNKYGFYNKSGDDFFRIDEYSEANVLNYFKDKKTQLATDSYKKMITVCDEAKMNTVQIILVKVADLRTFFYNYKNQVMQIEEDPYYFRKYILVYTEEAIDEIEKYSISELEKFILDDNNYDCFEKDLYSIPSFFVCMECYIKLPFLTLPIRDENYVSLNHLIQEEFNTLNQKKEEENAMEIINFLGCEETENAISVDQLVDIEQETDIIKRLKELYKTS